MRAAGSNVQCNGMLVALQNRCNSKLSYPELDRKESLATRHLRSIRRRGFPAELSGPDGPRYSKLSP